MKKIFGIVLVVSLLFAVPVFAAGNEVKNAGFSSGNLNHWHEVSPALTDVSIATSQYLSPNYSAKFTAWNFVKDRQLSLSQGFSVTPDTIYRFGARLLNLSSFESLRNGAAAWVSLVCYTNANDKVELGSVNTKELTAPNDDWQRFIAFGEAPKGASYAELYLNMYSPKMFGDSRTVYFDNAYFGAKAAPEPVSSALFLLGGAALAVRQYRNKKRT